MAMPSSSAPTRPMKPRLLINQKRRHIFGDLKMECRFGSKVQSTVPTSKRRGLSRATWSMRLKPPQVPRRRLRRGRLHGARVLPGNYTVKMTKDQQVYNSKLQVSADPAPSIPRTTGGHSSTSP